MSAPFTDVTNEFHQEPEVIQSGGDSGKPNVFAGIEAKSDKWIEMACHAALESVEQGGGPFGALLLQIDCSTKRILRYWVGHNVVVQQNDPTAHAEVQAIRSACHDLGVFNLGEIGKEDSQLSQPSEKSYCVIYSSCEPCPMCYAAIAWSRIQYLYFAATRFDAAQPGVDFSDLEFYSELEKPYAKRSIQTLKCNAPNALMPFDKWKKMGHSPY